MCLSQKTRNVSAAVNFPYGRCAPFEKDVFSIIFMRSDMKLNLKRISFDKLRIEIISNIYITISFYLL